MKNLNQNHQKYRTDNNVFVSKFILDIINKIKLNDSIYQYCYNFDINKMNQFYDVDYINFGVDGIIRDLFYINRNKTVYFETPNYMMVQKYAGTFNMKLTTFEEAEVVYISYPNGATLKDPDFELKTYDKTVILDVSYLGYAFSDFERFKSAIRAYKALGYYVLYGPSKTLGLPGLRVGFCECKNPEIFNDIHQPWQITSTSKLILDELWKPEIINEHFKIINKSKEYFEQKYKDLIAFKTDLPCLALNSEIEYQTRKYGDYYRFSIIDHNLLETSNN